MTRYLPDPLSQRNLKILVIFVVFRTHIVRIIMFVYSLSILSDGILCTHGIKFAEPQNFVHSTVALL